MEEIDKKIIQIFRDNISGDISKPQLSFSQPIKDMSFLDSLSVLNIVVALEKEFNVSFELDNLDQAFKDINSVKDYIIKNKKS